jgi:hypothetical protein
MLNLESPRAHFFSKITPPAVEPRCIGGWSLPIILSSEGVWTENYAYAYRILKLRNYEFLNFPSEKYSEIVQIYEISKRSELIEH